MFNYSRGWYQAIISKRNNSNEYFLCRHRVGNKARTDGKHWTRSPNIRYCSPSIVRVLICMCCEES